MNLDKMHYRALRSWLSLGLLVILVCALGVLQYRWLGEISQVEKKKLQDDLQSGLNEVGHDFDSELINFRVALQPTAREVKEMGREKAYERRYVRWKKAATHAKLLDRIALTWDNDGQIELRLLDLRRGVFLPADWPSAWSGMRERITAKLQRGLDGPGRPRDFMRGFDDTALIEMPRFGGPPGSGEQEWLIAEVDASYAAAGFLPELLARHFGPNYRAEYEIALTPRSKASLSGNADASVTVFNGGGGAGPGGPRRGPSHARGHGPDRPFSGDAGMGRWLLSIHLKSGSLDDVVARARLRNLGVSAGILLLLVATGASLLRFSRQAQRLADAEMEFVANVSHELRTPLTVIRTAAFNLRGRLAHDAAHVERYGMLIQQESERLTAIVEQVLRFAGAKSGRGAMQRQPVRVESLIEDALQSTESALDAKCCRVEKHIEPELPAISGDAMTLRHALENLICNAVKYGMEERRWLGIEARAGANGSAVEIRIADHGPGIPADEQKHIFDAFFRGKKAVRDQLHGTGLGLNLVKKIVEGHGGTVEVESELGEGTTFVVRIPTGLVEHHNELVHSLS